MRETDVGRFLQWGAAVSIDTAEKLFRILPFSQPEDLVDIPNEDVPEDEALEARCTTW